LVTDVVKCNRCDKVALKTNCIKNVKFKIGNRCDKVALKTNCIKNVKFKIIKK